MTAPFQLRVDSNVGGKQASDSGHEGGSRSGYEDYNWLHKSHVAHEVQLPPSFSLLTDFQGIEFVSDVS